jgi:hypothetical protein
MRSGRHPPFAEHLTSYNRACIRDFLLKQTYWYDKNKCPSGLRYYGDGGPNSKADIEAWKAGDVQEEDIQELSLRECHKRN